MFGVKANVRAPHRFLRMGGLCWLHLTNPGWANEKVMVYGMSRGGRKVLTWVDSRDLTNWRAGWITDEPHFPDSPQFPFDTREEAQAFADSMNERFASEPVRPHAASFGRPDPPSL